MNKATGNTPVYLIVADDSEEFTNALRYAALAARRHGARIAMLKIIEEDNSVFLPWGRLQDDIESSYRHEAKAFVLRMAEQLNEYGVYPSFYIETGRPHEVVRDILNADHNITKLILAADTKSKSPGPLVSYFSNKGLSELRVPITIVPGHLSAEAIDHFVNID